mgnify:CR=1 FL=1
MARYSSSHAAQYGLVMAIALGGGALGCQKEQTQDSTEPPETPASSPAAAEIDAEVLFENEVAKVVRVRLDPGQAQPTHEAPARVVYSVTDSRIHWTEGGEDLGERTWEAGDVHFHSAGPHAAKNMADEPAEWLVFSRKTEAAPAEGESAETDDERPDQLEVLFENDVFLVGRVRLEPEEAMVEHPGRHRVVYNTTEASLTYREGDEEEKETSFDEGDVHFHGPGTHSVENTGSQPVEFLVVTYKSV